MRFCPFSVMIVAKKRGLVYFFLQPVLDHIIQRIRRDGEVGQLVDEREDAGPAHGDARDAGVALRLAGLCEDLHAIALGTPLHLEYYLINDSLLGGCAECYGMVMRGMPA